MALATEPTYSTYELFQLWTPVSAQQSNTFTEEMWKPFALKAEKIVDTYVFVKISQKYNEDQNLKFPIKDKNGNSLIPDDITLATIYITSDLILKGDAGPVDGMVANSESWNDSGYSISKLKKSSSSSDDMKVEIPALALRLLLPWNSKTASLTY